MRLARTKASLWRIKFNTSSVVSAPRKLTAGLALHADLSGVGLEQRGTEGALQRVQVVGVALVALLDQHGVIRGELLAWAMSSSKVAGVSLARALLRTRAMFSTA